MFFVIDKSKIFSYIIAICTVIILFVAATGLNNITEDNSIMTSTNVVNENKLLNNATISNATINNN